MKRIATMVCSVLLFGAGAVQAQSGIGINWDGCLADGPVPDKVFTCDVNTGAPFVFYVSLFPRTDVPHLEAVDVVVSVGSYLQSTPPPWWLTGTGQCRAGAIGMSFDPTVVGAGACAHLWEGAQPLSVMAAELSADGRLVQLHGLAAVAAGQEVSLPGDGTERIVCRVAIQRSKSTGADACSGCTACQMLVVSQIKLMQPPGEGDFIVSQPEPGFPYEIAWNGYCLPPDPVQNRTWGAIKGMYR